MPIAVCETRESCSTSAKTTKTTRKKITECLLHYCVPQQHTSSARLSNIAQLAHCIARRVSLACPGQDIVKHCISINFLSLISSFPPKTKRTNGRAGTMRTGQAASIIQQRHSKALRRQYDHQEPRMMRSKIWRLSVRLFLIWLRCGSWQGLSEAQVEEITARYSSICTCTRRLSTSGSLRAERPEEKATRDQSRSHTPVMLGRGATRCNAWHALVSTKSTRNLSNSSTQPMRLQAGTRPRERRP